VNVLLPDGSSLAGATVLLTKRGAAAEARVVGGAAAPAVPAAPVEAQGQGIDEGEYDVCVGMDPNAGILDPCEWPTEAKRLNVSAANGGPMAVRVGVGPKMRIQITDPGGALRHPREPVGFRPTALVGVFDGSGFFHMARIVNINRGTYTYVLPVPKGQNYTVHVSAPTVRFTENGGSVKETVAVPVAIGAADGRAEIPIQVGAVGGPVNGGGIR
jgi:hypothetical protein